MRVFVIQKIQNRLRFDKVIDNERVTTFGTYVVT